MIRSSFIGHLLPLVVSIAAIACSSSTTTEEGSGGKGSGGVSSSGGSGSGGVGSGGTQTGSGGKSGTGGVGSGGAATGGTSAGPTGGTTNTGGSIGKGGITGAPGGSGGTSSGEGGGAGSTSTRDGGPGGRTGGDGGPGRDGGAPGGRTGGGSGGQAGGTTGTTPTGGTGGSTGGGPCKASPCVILPLGDSITVGLNSSDSAGYRSQLFKLAVAANQNITFIGSQSGGPSTVSGKTFPSKHEGHSGITITGITGYVPPAKALTGTPHIVLVHIGTNDMTNKSDPTTAAKQLDTLVADLVAAAPEALIVVAKIVPLGYSDSNYTSYVGKIADVVKAHAGVVMVDMSTLPTSDIAGNGNVHPTDKGYADMANLWYGAIKDYLPQ